MTLGYALATSNRTISLVSVRDAMKDATYGAMKGEHWVVSHHLRQERQFEQAHAEARGAREWKATLPEPCTLWPKVALRSQQSGAAGGDKEPDLRSVFTRGDSRALEPAMRAFGCCQQWRLCEVWPKAV